MKPPDSNIHMHVYTHKHISICYIHTCTSTKVQIDSQKPDPKLICDWHSKGRYNRAPEKKVPLEETTKAHSFQNPANPLWHSSEAGRRPQGWMEGAGGATELGRHPCSASGQGKAGPARLAEWGQTAWGPRPVALSAEVRGWLC